MYRRFLDHDAVHFVAGRIFTHDGKKYYPGEKVDDAREWPNLESAVRTKYLWAVADDTGELPLRLQKEVKLYQAIRAKLNADKYLPDIEARDAEPERVPEETTFDPNWSNKDLLAYLDEHPQDIKNVLDMEREHQKRPRLIKALEERLAAPNEEEIDV